MGVTRKVIMPGTVDRWREIHPRIRKPQNNIFKNQNLRTPLVNACLGHPTLLMVDLFFEFLEGDGGSFGGPQIER